jgi:hypothetical protein
VLGARQGDLAQPEREVATLGDDLLSRWARAPGPVDRADWQRAEHSDARWVWIAVLALLVVEQWVRLRAQVSEDRGIHDAAA